MAECVVSNIRELKRLAAVVLISGGIHSLNGPNFLTAFKKRQQATADKIHKLATRKREKTMKSTRGVRVTREKWGHKRTHNCTKYSMDKCGIYL